jgi:3-oxoadipate enol-lactonase
VLPASSSTALSRCIAAEVLAHSLEGPRGAPAVVLAGSLGTTRAMWEPQLEALARLRVLRYDHPGHGESPLLDVRGVDGLARDLLALLDALELERVSFCGLSLGGAVGMQMAVAAPERVERLVLACTAARFPNAEAYGERAELVRREGVEPIADAVVARWFTPPFRDAHRDVVRRYRAMLVATPPEGYARCCEAVRDFDVRAQLSEIRAPTLVVAGADDPAAPPDVAPRVPGGRSVVLPDAAHLANVERPDAFSAALVEHLAA